ncbi:hypothetical protein EGN72_02450 [Pseudorhodobacter sp. E13]|uniref:phage tail tube protein n=1 Tax=Pseudorhodobacter sp. E13 TaxID=2487931 RepID=UPI000F8C3F14|nr:phage tail tube protein [Pseudorhodobacter sp. E13]RUS64871.1 hypothetical protein EGN72_02450 [Pseudorhodobacter sp. E13]
MPLFWRKKVLTFKLETTYGVDATPTGAANAILAIDMACMPMEGNDVSRELDLPYMAAQGTIPAELHSKITFKVELAPSGTAGTPPAWGPLLRACGCAQTIVATTSVTYNPVTDGHESATIYFNMDGTLVKMLGARGTCVMRVNAQGIPYLEFEFQGLFTVPTAAALPTADFTSFRKPEVASKTNTPTCTIGGTAMVMRSFALTLGNQLENRFLVGSEAVLITDRAESVEAVVEAVPLATLNPFSLAASQSQVPLVLTHGTVAGKRATINAPAAQMQRPQGAQNAQGVVEWPLRLVPLPVTGNDQFTLVLT